MEEKDKETIETYGDRDSRQIKKQETVVSRQRNSASQLKQETVVSRQRNPVGQGKQETVVSRKVLNNAAESTGQSWFELKKDGENDPQFKNLYDFLMHTEEFNMEKDEFEKSVCEHFGDTIHGFSGKTYFLEKKISFGGEAVILKCHDNEGRNFAAKVILDVKQGNHYTLQQICENKANLFFALKNDEARKYCCLVEDYGHLTLKQGTRYLVEFSTYYPQGDLGTQDAMSVAQLIPVIRQVNEALHFIHTKGLLHRDIKPENIFIDHDRYLIGDFGITCVLNSDQLRVTRINPGSPGYMAPEARNPSDTDRGQFYLLPPIDYYAFGVTLASLFVGEYVYEGIDYVPFSLKSTIPLPPEREDEKKEQFQNLINGLYQYDAELRFGYEDVNEWLKNQDYRVHFANPVENGRWTIPYKFNNEQLTDAYSMFQAFSNDWEKAIKHLFRGLIEDHFRKIGNQELASKAADIKENYSKKSDLGLYYFLRKLYPSGGLSWKDHVYQSLQELGQAMRDQSNQEFLMGCLLEGVVSDWLRTAENLTVDDNRNIEMVQRIEKLAAKYPETARNWFVFSFGGNKAFSFNGEQTTDTSSFISAALFSGYMFYGENGTLDILCGRTPEYYEPTMGFLCSLGHEQAVSYLRSNLKANHSEDLTNAEIIFRFMEMIANIEGKRFVRKKYLYFGPYAYVDYVRELANAGCYRVRRRTASQEEELIKQICNQPQIEEYLEKPLGSIYQDLCERSKDIDKLRNSIQNNPFLVKAGIHKGKTIKSVSLKGLFCKEFLGIQVPMGFFERLH